MRVVLECASVCECANVRVCECVSVQVFECVSVCERLLGAVPRSWPMCCIDGKGEDEKENRRRTKREQKENKRKGNSRVEAQVTRANASSEPR